MILTIQDPIHTQDVVVAIAESNAWTIIKAVKRAGYTIQDAEGFVQTLEFGVASAKTVMDHDSGAVVMRFQRLRPGNPDDVADLAHEVVHAATMLFDRVGFPLEAATDEPLAYYVGFLVRKVLEGVCRKKGVASAAKRKPMGRMCGTARRVSTAFATPAGPCSLNAGTRR